MIMSYLIDLLVLSLKVQNKEPWEDPAYLNTMLQEAMTATLGHHHNINQLERWYS